MNKAELIKTTAGDAEVTQAAASRFLDAYVKAITTELASGNSVSVVGFGNFKVSQRAARQGRNPKTGEPMAIAARNVPSFSAGKALKDAVN